MALKEEIKIHEIELTIIEREIDALFVVVEGWRIRLYFNEKMSKQVQENFKVGQRVIARYTGEIEDIHSVKFLPL